MSSVGRNSFYFSMIGFYPLHSAFLREKWPAMQEAGLNHFETIVANKQTKSFDNLVVRKLQEFRKEAKISSDEVQWSIRSRNIFAEISGEAWNTSLRNSMSAKKQGELLKHPRIRNNTRNLSHPPSLLANKTKSYWKQSWREQRGLPSRAKSFSGNSFPRRPWG